MDGDRIIKHLISNFSSPRDDGASANLDQTVYHTLLLVSTDARVEATITHMTDKHGDNHQRLTNVEMFRRNWNRLDLSSASPHL